MVTGSRSVAGGVGASVMNKQASKYNESEGELLLNWVKQAQLRDGTLLCKLALKLEPNSIKGMTEKASSAFQQMSNLELFIDFCRKQGVITQELFRAVDLVEARDLYSVCMTLNSLGRIMEKKGKPSPKHVSASEISGHETLGDETSGATKRRARRNVGRDETSGATKRRARRNVGRDETSGATKRRARRNVGRDETSGATKRRARRNVGRDETSGRERRAAKVGIRK
uniref:Calponin-homology (CH) domain-containing protein n=1 Tax=Globodera rostochiensis TaxID=31243 RepID=A0A914I5S5_GLORO